ncbi:metalloregulator ArsR/SmtB family transcription factor [uncultured Cohaesibacter sp.]|uniref:ArsR/SmtB family transcription factor n=1 Tax=uncultured Cohaesibacter sp. TaxID=1002546 RepID=UPI0029C7B300|nr:metalloregulator ArsR/SmtB family transcription factor [uncultured Cohaesibacter sp.]
MGKGKGCGWHGSAGTLDVDLADPVVADDEHGRCCDHFDPLARAFKALGHPARLMILKKLSSQSSHCCGDICSTLPLAQSTVSQHLKVLKDCGFIQLETAGQQSRYTVNFERLTQFLGENNAFFESLRDRRGETHTD